MNDRNDTYTKDALEKKIRALSFAALEANLYLDGHPSDKEALAYFRKTNEELCRMTEAYEEEYAPLTAAGDGYHDGFSWATMPFPWEMEA